MTQVKGNKQLAVKTPIPEALQKINSKLNSLKEITESNYKTPGKLAGFSVNLQQETKTAELIKMYSAVKARERHYTEAADELGIDTYPVFSIDGGTKEQWFADVKLRIALIEQKGTIEKLRGLKKEFEELMDKDDRLAILTQKLQDL